MKLTDTVEMMNSQDFKERFRAEYFQLINRIEGLADMLVKYRAGTLTFTPNCSLKLLDGQLRSMLMYKTHLEEKAKLESISLEEPVIVEAKESETDVEDDNAEVVTDKTK